MTQPASVGDSFGWGWNKFVANLGPIIVTVLVYLVVATLISLLWNVVLGTANLGVNRMDRYGTWTGLGAVGAIGAFLGSALLTVVVLFVTYVLEAAITRGALVISYGQRLELRTMFQFPNLGAVLLAALLVSVLTSIGSLVCGVGALVVGYFVQFTLFFVIDKAQNAIDGLRSSFQLVTKNAATVLLFSVAAIVAVVIGALLCGIGLVVAIPVVILAQTYLYRRLLGEPVAP